MVLMGRDLPDITKWQSTHDPPAIGKIFLKHVRTIEEAVAEMLMLSFLLEHKHN